jgi:hypothetical protein
VLVLATAETASGVAELVDPSWRLLDPGVPDRGAQVVATSTVGDIRRSGD